MFGLSFFREVQADLKKVEEELFNAVTTDNPLLKEASLHLLHAGGKRLRPAFALLAAKFHDYSLQKLMPLAVALEMIHMASLVHDDVIDQSMLRRGIPTVKARWGDQISLNTGDYLFARSLILISKYNNPRISSVLAEVSVEMCQGEIQQIATTYDIKQGLRDYYYRIKRKTALLISASCQLGAVASGAPDDIIRGLKKYGYYLGMAFQITDDVLDMVADEKSLGKPVGSDLQQGILTLPTILALRQSQYSSQLNTILLNKEKDQNDILQAIELIKEAGSIEESLEIASKFIYKAKEQLKPLPHIPARKSLVYIADFVQSRNF